MNRNKKIKVLHIITRLTMSGAPENTFLTAKGLSQKGYDVTLVGGFGDLQGDLISRIKKEKINLMVLSSIKNYISPFYDVKTIFKLYRLIKRNKYDLIHTHCTKAGFLGRIAANLAGAPLIIHGLHGMPVTENKLINKLYNLGERILYNYTDQYISVADSVTKKLKKRISLSDNHKFKTIYSGMELDLFLNQKEDKKLKNKYNIKEDEFVVGKIAGLVPFKGCSYLLKAAAKILEEIPHARFFMIGDGILRKQLKKEAKKLGITDNLIFTGLVPREEIPRYLSILDLLVHTSLKEGLPRVIPQALASGKPALSFNLDGAPEVIDHGRNGYLISPKNINELAEKTIYLLKNKEIRKKMGRQGRRTVNPRFREETMVSQIEKVYQRLLNRK